MVLTKYDDIIKSLTSGKQKEMFWWKGNTAVKGAGSPHSLFRPPVTSAAVGGGGFPGMALNATIPTNEICDNDSAGALRIGNPTGGDKSYISNFGCATAAAVGTFMLVDRLCHTGGLSGTVTGAQTTNLPTPALTRYTTGEDVLLGVQCWTVTGSTLATITASYTNQNGTSGRTTPTVNFWTGGMGSGTQPPVENQLQFLPLQVPDTGVRAVASVTLSASTLTAGNFGVVLMRPLAMVSTVLNSHIDRDLVLQPLDMPEKIDNACLDLVFFPGGTTTTNISGNIKTVEIP